ncbi:putative PEP-binding protein [Bacillus pacificus]
MDNGGERVGLYRTEFLYTWAVTIFQQKKSSSEHIKQVLEGVKRCQPVVVRTLDIGGDKEPPYPHLPKEMNPFLGYRAIQLMS